MVVIQDWQSAIHQMKQHMAQQGDCIVSQETSMSTQFRLGRRLEDSRQPSELAGSRDHTQMGLGVFRNGRI